MTISARFNIVFELLFIITLTGCGAGSSSAGGGSSGSGGTLTLTNAPATTGGTFSSYTLPNASKPIVLWLEEGTAGHIESVTMYLNAGKTFDTIVFHSQDYAGTPPNETLTVNDWTCNSSCIGITLNQSTGTLSFANTVFTGIVVLSGSTAPSPITINGALKFTP